MTIPPSGIVTFLFTDIEGSTKLAQKYAGKMHNILLDHENIFRKIISENNGYTFKSIGDAFCCAFEDSADAVIAACQIQMMLNNGKTNDTDLKVRIGIHSGEAEWIGRDYSGYLTLARSNRVMSAAYGGQIILSKDVYTSAKSKTPSEISYRDLGQRRLKDLIHPVHLYQVLSEGLKEDFPPLKTLDLRPNNLPVQLTSFIGRENEINEIKSLISETHLLTLTGAGGSGKTRLALQAGAELLSDFANGVFLAELASLSDPLTINTEIASVLEINPDGKKDINSVLIDYLKEKELMIILDNCEHLVKECAELTDILLKSCPKLKILASSREPLHSIGELIYKVPVLSLPDVNSELDFESITRFESVRLFTERANAVNVKFKITADNFRIIGQLCHELDGIPLAIELAAARVKILPVDKILERLKNRFNLLTGGKRTSLPRQQTLKAMIDWSYDLLSEKEKILFLRLSVFNGGCTLEAAEKICQDNNLEESEILDLISNLTDKSLLKVYESEYNIRYTMLETIRQYGSYKSAESENSSALKAKYCEYYYKFTENSEEKLRGSGQREWLIRIKDDYENIRECIRASLENDSTLAMKFCSALGKFWEVQSYFSEGLEYIDRAMKNLNSEDPELTGKGLYWKGFFLIQKGKYKDSGIFLEKCVELFSEVKSKDWEARSLLALGVMNLYISDYEKLNFYYEKSLAIAKEIKNEAYIAANLQLLASALMQQSRYDEAREKFEESLALFRKLNDYVNQAKIIGNIGLLEYWLLNYNKAVSYYEESLSLRKDLNDKQGIAIALNNLGAVYYMQGYHDKAQQLLEESLKIARELGDIRISVFPLSTIGLIETEYKRYSESMKLFGEVISISKELNDKYSLAKGFDGYAYNFLLLKKFEPACIAAEKYISLMSASNKNVTDAERDRFEMFRTSLKDNLGIEKFEKFWKKGEAMNVDEAFGYICRFENPD